MMVTGIVLTSVSPVGLLIWWGGVVRCGGGLDEPCDNTAQTLLGLGTFAALAGVGIPLMVIGGHREKPTPSASIGPWLSPRSAGLTVQLNL